MSSIIRRGTAVGLTVAACALIAGCDDSYLDQGPARSQQPISAATLAEMEKLDTTPSSPTLIRTYKKEAELEIWKMKSNGEYALLKTYPMCRWSGQLGPKKREGDMQVPEGFYSITPGQMNPNSHYYLAFNVGYPNAYDRAYGRTGGNVMVHGVCSSAGCFSMTDEQVADIYAIAREFLPRRPARDPAPVLSVPHDGREHGQVPARSQHRFLEKPERRLRPFRGHQDRAVRPRLRQALCFRRDRERRGCPAASRAPRSSATNSVEALVAEKESKDEAKVAELVASGVKPIRLVYADGGQNPVFAGYKDTSDPDALANPPQEIVLNDRAKPAPAVVKIAVADADKKRGDARALRPRRSRRRRRSPPRLRSRPSRRRRTNPAECSAD